MKMNKWTVLEAVVISITALLCPLFAQGADSAFLWTGGGDGWDYFDSNNWSEVEFGGGPAVPVNDSLWINNGDSVLADPVSQGGSSPQPVRLYVGVAESGRPGDPPTGVSSLTLVGVDQSPGMGMKVGFNNQVQQDVSGAFIMTNGSLTLNTLSFIFVGVASGDLGGSTTKGEVDIDGDLLGDYNDTETLQVGQYTSSTSQTGTVVGVVNVRQKMENWRYINVGVHINNGGAGSVTGSLSVAEGIQLASSFLDDFADPTITIGSASGAEARAKGSLDVTGNIAEHAALHIGIAEGDATTSVEGSVTLRSSHARIHEVIVGRASNGVESVSASLTLNPSLLSASNLTVSSQGTLAFALGGTNRVTSNTVGNAGTYAAADVAGTATLAGTLDIVYTNGFFATLGSLFEIIHADELTGTFDTVTFPDSDPSWEINYTSNRVIIGKTGPDNPVLRWALEEGVGTNTEEAISGQTDVAHFVEGPTWTNGLAPGSSAAVNFQMTSPDSYIDAGTLSTNGMYIPNSTETNGAILTGAWTITAWVNIPDWGYVYADRSIITSDTAGGQNWWLFFIRDQGGIRRNLGFDFAQTRLYSNLIVPTNRTVFVSIACDVSATAFGEGMRCRFAIWDGTSFVTEEGIRYSNLRLDGLEIGSFADGQNEFLGDLDEVRIYNRALNMDELFDLAVANGIDGDLGGNVIAETNAITSMLTSNVEFQITFTEDVQFFDAADLNITGTLTSSTPVITGAGNVYTASVPFTGQGTIIVDLIPGAGVQSLSGESLIYHIPSQTVIVDYTPPFVVSITPDSTGPVTNSVGFTVVFSEPVQGFNNGDPVNVQSTNLQFSSNIQNLTTTSSTTYTFEIQMQVVDGKVSGTYATSISMLNIEDLFGNPMTPPNPTSDVVLVSANRYQQWAIANGLTNGGDFGLTSNPDNDTRLNGCEFLHDGDPLAPFDRIKRAIHFADVDGTNYFVLTIAAPEDAVYQQEDAVYQQEGDDGEGPPPEFSTTYQIEDYMHWVEQILPASDMYNFGAGALTIIEEPSIPLPPGLPALSTGFNYRNFRLSIPVDNLPAGFIMTYSFDGED